MPNWCINYLTVNGDADSLRQFSANFRGQPLKWEGAGNTPAGGVCCLHALVPVPEDVIEDGADAIREWCLENWGTQWDIGTYDETLLDAGDTHFTLEFETAWSPPTAWVESVAQRFPALTLTLSYYEDQLGYAGQLRIHNAGDEASSMELDPDQDPDGFCDFMGEAFGWEHDAIADLLVQPRTEEAAGPAEEEAPGPDAVPGLMEELQAHDPTTRWDAAIALGAIGPHAAEASPALIQSLSDEEASVREQAAQALGLIGSDAETAIPALIEALKDPNPDVRVSAADALARFGADAEDAIQPLTEGCEDQDERTREACQEALAQIQRAI